MTASCLFSSMNNSPYIVILVWWAERYLFTGREHLFLKCLPLEYSLLTWKWGYFELDNIHLKKSRPSSRLSSWRCLVIFTERSQPFHYFSFKRHVGHASPCLSSVNPLLSLSLSSDNEITDTSAQDNLAAASDLALSVYFWELVKKCPQFIPDTSPPPLLMLM